jgi:hypothetical protein
MPTKKRIVKTPYNPDMNPFAPIPDVRFESRWSLGNPNAVYEFNIKLPLLHSSINDEHLYFAASDAIHHFEHKLRARYPWIGLVDVCGRSGGWLTIEDPQGRMTRPVLLTISKLVKDGKRKFCRKIEEQYPRDSSSPNRARRHDPIGRLVHKAASKVARLFTSKKHR